MAVGRVLGIAPVDGFEESNKVRIVCNGRLGSHDSIWHTRSARCNVTRIRNRRTQCAEG